MNYDDMVKRIVEEIYGNIKEDEIDESTKKKAIIIGKVNNNKLGKGLKENYQLIAYENNIKNGDLVIIEYLDIKEIANIALLVPTNGKEEFIIKMLLEGKKVFISEDGLEYKKYKETAPRALYNEYLNLEKKLKLYGMEVIKYSYEIIEQDEIKEKCRTKVKYINEEILEEESTFYIKNKKIISEGDLKKPFMQGKKIIIIDSKSIITPLADDFIKIHNLKIERV